MTLRKTLAVSVVLTTFLTSALPAGAEGQTVDLTRWFGVALRYGNGTQSVDQAQSMVALTILGNDLDGAPGLSANDAAIVATITDAMFRSQAVTEGLTYDLDGDFTVTRSEVAAVGTQRAAQPITSQGVAFAPSREQRETIVRTFVDRVFAADSDGDGRLTLTELAAGNMRGGRGQSAQQQSEILDMVAVFDGNADGTATEAEIAAFLNPIIAAIDTDHDAQISDVEMNAVFQSGAFARISRQPAANQTPEPAPAQCKLGKPLEGSEILAIGGYEGAALSDVQLQSPNGSTHVADLVIPDSATPVHLLVQFYGPTVLRLTGATDRVRAITNIGGPVGFTGITRDQLAVLNDAAESCESQVWEGAVKNDDLQIATLNGVFDQRSHMTFAEYTIGSFDFGTRTNIADQPLADAIDPGFDGAAGDAWARMLAYNPGGFVEIAPDQVVSTLKVTKAAVWPQSAGLAQLLAARAISSLDVPGTVVELREVAPGKVRLGGKTFIPGLGDDVIVSNGLDYIRDSPGLWTGRPRPEYLINEKITLPADLSGANAVKLYLADGVPAPDGNPGQSKVIKVEKAASGN